MCGNIRHDVAPWSPSIPHVAQRCVNMQSWPYGHPAGALLNRRHVPGLFTRFAGGLPVPAPFMVVEPHGLLFLPSDTCTMSLAEMGWISDSLLVLIDCSVRLKGSLLALGPGRQVIYCQGSPLVQVLSSEAAPSPYETGRHTLAKLYCLVLFQKALIQCVDGTPCMRPFLPSFLP